MKYHLGCGGIYLNGYFNVDFPQEEHPIVHGIKADLYADILIMPYENNVEEIKSHHVFEHFNYIDSFVLLYRWTKALKENGNLFIGVPDVKALSKVLLSNDITRSFRAIRYLYGSHEAKWAYHINGWTNETLSYVLTNIGFSIGLIKNEGDINSNQPNCSLTVHGILIKKFDQEVLKITLKKLLKLYMNGDHPCEVELWNLWCKAFDKKTVNF